MTQFTQGVSFPQQARKHQVLTACACVCRLLSYSARAALIKHSNVGGYRHVFPHSCGGWKSGVMVLAWSGSGEILLPGCTRRLTSPCILTGGKVERLALWPLFLKRHKSPSRRFTSHDLITYQMPHLQIPPH